MPLPFPATVRCKKDTTRKKDNMVVSRLHLPRANWLVAYHMLNVRSQQQGINFDLVVILTKASLNWLHFISKQGKMQVGKSWGRLSKWESLTIVGNAGAIISYCWRRLGFKGSGASIDAEGDRPVWWTAAGRGREKSQKEPGSRTDQGGESNAQRHQIATLYITRQNTLPAQLEHHLISSFVCLSEATTPQTPYTLTAFTTDTSAIASGCLS